MLRRFRPAPESIARPRAQAAEDAAREAVIDDYEDLLPPGPELHPEVLVVGGARRAVEVLGESHESEGGEAVADGNSVVISNTKLRTADLYPLSKTPLKLLLDDRIDLVLRELPRQLLDRPRRFPARFPWRLPYPSW